MARLQTLLRANESYWTSVHHGKCVHLRPSDDFTSVANER